MQQTHTGILVVSFGTSVKHAKLQTIDTIKHRIQQEFPSFPVYEAWTSSFLRKKWNTQEAVSIPDITEALKIMRSDGIHTVIVQPTFVIHGAEYSQMRTDALALAGEFFSMTIGSPLLDSPDDACKLAAAIADEAKRTFECTPDDMIVFMGHGTSPAAFSVSEDSDADDRYNNPDALYDLVDAELKASGNSGMFLRLMNSDDAVDELLEYARKHDPAAIVLAPFMLTAGRHALKDMAGEHETSWASRFQTAGFHVRCMFKGLGEYESVQMMFLDRVREMLRSI